MCISRKCQKRKSAAVLVSHECNFLTSQSLQIANRLFAEKFLPVKKEALLRLQIIHLLLKWFSEIFSRLNRHGFNRDLGVI